MKAIFGLKQKMQQLKLHIPEDERKERKAGNEGLRRKAKAAYSIHLNKKYSGLCISLSSS